jgi:hypothetical protein
VPPGQRLKPPSWLLVFWGDADWPTLVADAITDVAARDPEAHHILSREVDGPRWSLLLVHWSEAERDDLLRGLGDRWEHVFVNEVRDLADGPSSAAAS